MPAQNNLALRLIEARGTTPDPAEAIRWYGAAAQQGCVPAQYNLGRHLVEGDGVPMNAEMGAHWLRLAAVAGHPEAQYCLAGVYDDGTLLGDSSEKAQAEAYKWYRKAAEGGKVEAQFAVAVALERGEGCEPDPEHAIDWYTLAAENGHATAQFNIGVLYLQGRGVIPDDVRAAEYFRKPPNRPWRVRNVTSAPCTSAGAVWRKARSRPYVGTPWRPSRVCRVHSITSR